MHPFRRSGPIALGLAAALLSLGATSLWAANWEAYLQGVTTNNKIGTYNVFSNTFLGTGNFIDDGLDSTHGSECNTIVGHSNTLKRWNSYSYVMGDGNTITGGTTDRDRNENAVFGNGNSIQGNRNTLMGFYNNLFGDTTAWGNKEWRTAVGYYNSIFDDYGTTVGSFNSSTSRGSVAIGTGNNYIAVMQANSNVIDPSASKPEKSGYNSVAVGVFNHTPASQSTALGSENRASGAFSVAVGAGLYDEAASHVAGKPIVRFNEATGDKSVAIGYTNRASGVSSIAVGTENRVTGARSGAIGDPNYVGGTGNYAFGNDNVIGSTTANAFVLGNNVKLGATGVVYDAVTNTVTYQGETDVTGALALGNATAVTVKGGVALGANSLASIDKGAAGYDPITGKTSTQTSAAWKATNAAVSVGKADGSMTRQITGLAAGTAPTDAVNVAQLKTLADNLSAADNSVQYDGTDKKVVTLAGTGGTKITNLTDGKVEAGSSDAVNGSQLAATNANVTNNTSNITKNTTAIAGNTTKIEGNTSSIATINSTLDAGTFTVSANGGTKDRIARDQNIDFAKGTNTTVSYDAEKNKFVYSVADAPTFTGTVTAPNFKTSGANAVTVDGSTGTITGLTNKTWDGKTFVSGQAATEDQLKLVNDKLGTVDNNSVQYDTKDGSVDKSSVTLAGTKYVAANGTTPASGGTKITNVADGKVEAGSSDAVNGSQLFATNTNVTNNTNNITKNTTAIAGNTTKIEGNTSSIATINSTLDAGTFTVSANGGTKDRIARDQNIDFAKGTNTTVTYDAEKNKFVYSVVDAPTFTGTVTAPNFKTSGTNVVTVDGSTGTITGLTNKTWDGKTFISGQAATEDQLKLVNDKLGTVDNYGGWTVKANGDAGQKIGADGSVDFLNGTKTLVTRDGNKITVDLNQAAKDSLTKADNSVQYDKNSDGTVNKNSVTLGGTKYVAASGTTPASGGTKITNLADGTLAAGSSDAVNGSQLFATNTNVTNNTNNIAKNTTAIAGNTTSITKNTGDISTINSTLDAGTFTVSANGGDKDRIARDQNIDFAKGTNTKVTYDAEKNKFVYSVVDAPTFTGTVTAPTFKTSGANAVTVDGNTGTITGLTNKTWDGKTFVSGQAATEDQLKLVNDKLGTVDNYGGWTVKANGDAGQKIGADGSVDFLNGTKTLVTRDGNKITVDLNDDAKASIDNSVQYDGTDKKVVTLAGTDGTTITNVKAGELSTTSKDAVNGSQLFATNTNVTNNTSSIATINSTLDAGTFTVSANGGTKDRIARDQNIDFAKGTNTTVTYDKDSNKFVYSVVDAPTFTGTVTAPTFKTSGTNAVTVDGSTGTITGLTNKTLDVKDFATVGRAATEEQLKAVGDKLTTVDNYGGWTVKANGDAGQKIGADGSVDFLNGTKTLVTRDGNKITVDLNDAAKASLDNSVQYDGTDKKLVTLAGTDGTTITNVKAGELSATSKDAVNGSQLAATNTNVTNNTSNITKNTTAIAGNTTKIEGNTSSITTINSTLDAGTFTVSANGGDKDRIARDQNIDFADGTNTKVIYDAEKNKFVYSVADAPTFTGTVTAPTFKTSGSNAVTVDGNTGTITGLTNKTWDGKTFVSGQAATEDQLKLVNDNLGSASAWKLQANGKSERVIAKDSIVNFVNGDKTAVTVAGNDVKIDLNQAAKDSLTKADNSVQYDTKDGSVDKSSVTLAGTKYVAANGTTPASGGTKITNLADGKVEAGSSDAVNGSQLFATNTNVTNNTNNIAKNTTAIAGNTSSITSLQGGFTVSNADGSVKPTITLGGTDKQNVAFKGETGKIGVAVAQAGDGATVTVTADKDLGKNIDISNNSAITNINDNLGSASAWKLQANGKSERVIAKDNIVNFVNGDKTAVTAAGNDVKIDLNQAAKDSLTKADNSVQYDTKDGTVDKNSVTLAGGTDGTTITNVKAGELTATSKDAVNGSQLFATNTDVTNNTNNITKNTGDISTINSTLDAGTFTVSANGGTKDRIARDQNIDFDKGTNTTVTYDKDSNKFVYSVVDAPTFTGTVTAPTFKTSGANAVTVDGSTGTITGLTNKTWDGKTFVSGQAATEDQLKLVNDKLGTVDNYGGWTVKANGDAGQKIGADGSVDFLNGTKTLVTRDGNKITVDLNQAAKDSLTKADNSVQYDKNSDGTVNKNSVTLGGTKYVAASGTTPASGGTKISNVADGKVEAGSSDAVNGSQLFATNTNVTNNTSSIITINNTLTNGTFTVSANGGDKDRIARDQNIDFAKGTNTTVTYDKDSNKFVYSVVDAPTFTGTVTAPTFKASGTNVVKVDGSTGTITGLTNKTWDGKTFVSGQAATEDQLKLVNDKLGTVDNYGGWTVKANGDAGQKIGADGSVDFLNGTKTLVTRDGNKITVDLNDDAKASLDNSVQYDKNSDGTVNKNSVTLGGTKYVAASGTMPASGGTKISNVADGKVEAGSSDAVNGSQLAATNANVANNAKNIAKNAQDIQNITGDITAIQKSDSLSVKYDGESKDKVTLGGKDAQAPVSLTNVKDGAVNAKSTDAVNGSQLSKISSSIKDIIGDSATVKADGTVTTKNIGGTGGNTIDQAFANLKKDVMAGGRWKLTTNGKSVTTVNPGDTVDISGDKNIVVTKGEHDANVKLALASNLDLGDKGSVKMGNTTIDNSGLTVKGGPSVTAKGIDAGGKTISNLADGERDDDAATLGQLKSVAGGMRSLAGQVQKVSGRIDSVGAMAAAFSAIVPLDYDEAHRTQVSVGFGHYGGENALALGVLHYVNRDLLLNAGMALSDDEKSYRLGATFRIGRSPLYDRGHGTDREGKTVRVSTTEMLALRQVDGLKKVVEDQTQALAQREQQSDEQQRQLEYQRQLIGQLMARMSRLEHPKKNK